MRSSLLPLAPLALLLLLLAPGLRAGRRRSKHYCPEEPICQSDRFDVVYSHFDDHTDCKVYKCQCRIPDVITCPQGSPQQKTDTHGCQYYECVSCPVQQTVCRGSRISVFRGNDANGCALRACECPANPSRPQCSSNEELQQQVDASGCTSYQCRQVRAQCPEKPSCSANQELVSAGRVNNCDIYKCECLTSKKPACSLGSQPRLQDDGLGCKEYRCVENRSPCPPEPTCPSSHQVVSQDGVDENNCVKYQCKCIPLSPIKCPDGYRMDLVTDESCGCQYYKCEPNCQEKPNCPSVYEHAVVMATISNGCPSYSCVCREPEVISCADENAHLALITATDGSNCQTYVCRTETDSRSGCVQPTCANPVPTGQFGADGCPRYNCGGGNRNGGACSIPTCPVGQTPVQVGFLSRNCPHYECQSTQCSLPSSCSISQTASVRTNLQGCLTVTCANNGNNRNNGNQQCVVPTCANGLQPQQYGTATSGCVRYVCARSGCPLPQVACGLNQEPIVSGYDARNCPIYTCSSRRSANCPSNPQCLQGESLYYAGEDSRSCPEYVCYRSGCPTPPTCTVGEVLQDLGLSTDGSSCRRYSCQRSGGTCAARPNCGLGQLADVIGYDSVSGCPRYACPGGGTRSGGGTSSHCPPAPACGAGQTLLSYGMDGLGCQQYVCQVSTVGTVNSRSGGGVVTMNNGWPVVNGMRNVGVVTSTTCPPQPSCQYQQFRQRTVQQLANGQVCSVYTCTNIGSYGGRPRKCLDNPTYCDSTQSVETYKVKLGKYKRCQRIVCKGATNAAYY